MQFLLFRLYGPMAAYGDIAVGERRPSFAHPTRSGVLGLLGAALGMERGDPRLEVLHRALGVATRLDGVDGFMSDFHTVEYVRRPEGINRFRKAHGHEPRYRAEELDASAIDEKGNVTLSRRDYLMDTQSIVAVWEEASAEIDLARLRVALLQPTFVLYLGRKSCPPALPLHPVIVDAAHPVDALDLWDTHDHFWEKHHASRNSDWGGSAEYRWPPGDWPATHKPLQTVQRRDQPHSRRRWQFTERMEHVLLRPRPQHQEVDDDVDVTDSAAP